MNHIRNFSIIAHIDHGKSTLADRMLELTHTVEGRKMQDQVLDSMELERERGITIKMQPVRMTYEQYVLNLIDTPGHIDFSYEVSRALRAVEGALLLVDATQGVEAQTLSTLMTAQELDLVIIPVVTKIDAGAARTEEVKEEVATLLDVSTDAVHEVSGKTGEGVESLIQAIIEAVPPPTQDKESDLQGLVFDFEYSDHRGIIVYVRIVKGSIASSDDVVLKAAGRSFTVLDVGKFVPMKQSVDVLEAGMIGYVTTGIKEPGIASVGDTIIEKGKGTAELPGYKEVQPVVWASIFPESQDDFTSLRQALERLRLSDASLTFDEEKSAVLGRGYRCGFLGMLHLEIVTERLRREFNLPLIISTPSVAYSVTDASGETKTVYTPSHFPDHGTYERAREPWVKGDIIGRPEDVGAVMQLLYEHEADVGDVESFGNDRTMMHFAMPMRELYRNMFDDLKSATSGYASLSYDIADKREADVTRLDVLVAEEEVPAFARVVSKARAQKEAERIVERLYDVLPRQQFATKIQVSGLGRILSSKTLPALRKDVTGHLYGGDVTRKRKLLEKQKKGKKRLRAEGSVSIPQDVYVKMMRADLE